MNQAPRWPVYAFLTVVTVAAFAVGIQNDFTNWDDPKYITENRLIRDLSAERLVVSFTSFYFENYNPLHLVSYMLNYTLWGPNPVGFFVINVLLHLAAGLLVFEVFFALTRRPFTATFVALVFLIHPTRCESVVWLSERKDVLMAFFALAAVRVFLAYTTRVEVAGAVGTRSRGLALYLVSILLFVLALLSKSQIVALPIVLWGVSVFLRRPAGRAALEQLPFLALSALFTVLTLKAHEGVASASVAATNLLKPLVALPEYLLHSVFPIGLSPLYVHGDSEIHSAVAIGRGLLTVGVLGWLLWLGRARPAIRTGALWFLVLWIPVSGLVGNTVTVADRYLYLPLIGLAWIAGELLEPYLSRRARALSLAATATVLVMLTASYTTVWRSSETLWTHVLRHEPDSALAQANLGAHYQAIGRVEEARGLFEEDLARPPYIAESFFGLADMERREGRVDEALSIFRRLLDKTQDESDKATLRFAAFLIDLDRAQEALAFLQAHPPSRSSYFSESVFFRVHFQLGHLVEARKHAVRAVQHSLFHEEGRYHLGLCLERLEDGRGAVESYRKAIELERGLQAPYEALGSLLVRAGRIEETLGVLAAAPEQPASWWNLVAICHLRLNQREVALEALRQSIRLDRRNCRYLLNLARLALDLELREEARDSVRRALELDRDLLGSLEPAMRELVTEPD